MRVQLREYQDDCIEGIRGSFIRGSQKVAAVLPTGSGKTTIFGAICDKFLGKGTGERVVIVSHLGLLTSQTGDRFKEEWGIDSGVFQATRYPRKEDRCIITTMQSFRERAKIESWVSRNHFKSNDIDRLKVALIIVDEGHLFGNDSYEKIMDMFPNAKVILFTATPFKSNKLMTNLVDEVAYTISIQELIDQGFLVPPKLHMTPFDLTDQANIFSTIAHIYNQKHKGHKAVCYLKSIAEAKLCRQIMIDMGISCEAVTSKLTGEKRDKLLEAFRKGEGPDMLTTVDVLTAGFDSPNLRAIFMPYKVGSVTTYLQRVGRGLRPYTDKTHCDIYVGNKAPNITEGFWEKINKQMMNLGRKNYDNLLDALDYAKNDYSREQYEWTKEVVAMAKAARKRGMEHLFNMIITRQLPDALLTRLVENPPVLNNRNHKQPATQAQINALKHYNIDATNLTKGEAGNLIFNHKLVRGWKPPADEIVPSGTHKGKHFSQVPWAYWKHVKSSELKKAHNNYRRKMNDYNDKR